MKLEEKIDAMRRKLLIPIWIRGVSREQSFPNGKVLHLPGLTVPAYVANPLYNLDSKTWVKMLQATVHAAASRAVMKCHSGDRIKWEEGYVNGDFSGDYTPVIMAFGEADLRESAQSFEESENNGAVKFDIPYKPYMARLESAVVHGDKRATFPESGLSLHSLGDNRGIKVDSPKLFEVSLSRKEMKDIVLGINNQLKLRGYDNLYELSRKRCPCDWGTALDITKNAKCLYSNAETEVDHPEIFLVYSKVAQALTSKFTRKLVDYVNSLPEFNSGMLRAG